MLEADLVDELNLMIEPIVLGGKGMFPTDGAARRFERADRGLSLRFSESPMRLRLVCDERDALTLVPESEGLIAGVYALVFAHRRDRVVNADLARFDRLWTDWDEGEWNQVVVCRGRADRGRIAHRTVIRKIESCPRRAVVLHENEVPSVPEDGEALIDREADRGPIPRDLQARDVSTYGIRRYGAGAGGAARILSVRAAVGVEFDSAELGEDRRPTDGGVFEDR